MDGSMRQGFTLVELSIVLVILGLLVGGVLAGQSLIHAAELRSVTTEFRNLQTAYGAFREKYFALPGDMKNAVSFWGAQAGGTAEGVDATCQALDASTPSTDSKTCNGDGSGIIDDSNPMSYEAPRSWQHLANAGLIEGSYTGVDTDNITPGLNAPGSRFKPGVWGVTGEYSGGVNLFTAKYGSTFYFSNAGNAVFKPEDLYGIDQKIDDGTPNKGRIVTWRDAAVPDCITATEDAYKLDYQGVSCIGIFISGY